MSKCSYPKIFLNYWRWNVTLPPLMIFGQKGRKPLKQNLLVTLYRGEVVAGVGKACVSSWQGTKEDDI